MQTKNELPEALQEELRIIVDKLLRLEGQMEEVLSEKNPQTVNSI